MLKWNMASYRKELLHKHVKCIMFQKQTPKLKPLRDTRANIHKSSLQILSSFQVYQMLNMLTLRLALQKCLLCKVINVYISLYYYLNPHTWKLETNFTCSRIYFHYINNHSGWSEFTYSLISVWPLLGCCCKFGMFLDYHKSFSFGSHLTFFV